MNILNTGIKNVRNVLRYSIGEGSIEELSRILNQRREYNNGRIIFFVDQYFENNDKILDKLTISNNDIIYFVSSREEPSTDSINKVVSELRIKNMIEPNAIVGMGGGSTMDFAKAVSNLMTNSGFAEDYQGWDLVRVPGVYKIGIPTLSGTGAEATRTCVMTNKKSGLKLGMNSDYTVFDQIILDPCLTSTVPRNQYFYSGMDAYIHCIESLSGKFRNAIGDAYSRETINLCRQVFLDEEMMSNINREKLMVASFLGGCAIATSYVGLIHPFSAGLSVVLGLRHCIANCIVMRAMQPFYPSAFDEFWKMSEKQSVEIPDGVASNLTDVQYKQLYDATISHEKPLTNALGERYLEILTFEKVVEIFKKM